MSEEVTRATWRDWTKTAILLLIMAAFYHMGRYDGQLEAKKHIQSYAAGAIDMHMRDLKAVREARPE